MSRAPVLFRVDAAPRLGWEHLSRCLVLAAALQRRRRPAYFLSQLDPGSLGLTVKRGGNEWIDADAPAGTPEDLEEIVREVRRIRPAAVVVDSPDVKEEYLAELRRMGVLVVSMDSAAGVRFPSRLIINPLLGARPRIVRIHARGTQVLLGARYAMVRPEIRRQRPIRRPGAGAAVPRPGGPGRRRSEQPGRRTGQAAAQLSARRPRGCGGAAVAPDLAGAEGAGGDVPGSAGGGVGAGAKCRRASPAVTSPSLPATPGRWNWRASACRSSMVVQSETHWPTAQRLEEEGAATCLGWHANVSAATLRQAVQELLADPLERQSMARCGRKLIDGRGPDRLVTALEVLLHPSRLVQAEAAAA